MNNKFIKPYSQPVLNGELGLTARDIATSLDTSAVKIREKLISRGFIERIKAQGFQAIPIAMVNEINSIPFTEYVLDVNASKFFVGKHDSEAGDGYLAFLINLEGSVLKINELASTDPIMMLMSSGMAIRAEQIRLEKKMVVLEAAALDQRAEVKQLAEAVASVTATTNYVSAMGFLRTRISHVTTGNAISLGRRAGKMCREGGVRIDTVHSEIYGTVQAYPEDVLEEAYKQLKDEGKIP